MSFHFSFHFLEKIVFSRAGVWNLWALFTLLCRKKKEEKKTFTIFFQREVEGFLLVFGFL